MASILKIGKRLATVVDMCPNCEVIADIGCDHGYVSCELVLENKARMVIATDRSEKCLMKAVSLADSINILPFLSFRVGDGFEPITKHDKIGCAIIAGMGGLEIIEILKNKPKKLYDFVLQPQNNVLELRHYLIDNGFKILEDILVYDDEKFYPILRVTKGKNHLADIEIYFGKSNFKEKNKVFYAYLLERKTALTRLRAQAGGLSHKSKEEFDYINQALALFGEDVSSEQPVSESSGLQTQEPAYADGIAQPAQTVSEQTEADLDGALQNNEEQNSAIDTKQNADDEQNLAEQSEAEQNDYAENDFDDEQSTTRQQNDLSEGNQIDAQTEVPSDEQEKVSNLEQNGENVESQLEAQVVELEQNEPSQVQYKNQNDDAQNLDQNFGDNKDVETSNENEVRTEQNQDESAQSQDYSLIDNDDDLADLARELGEKSSKKQGNGK